MSVRRSTVVALALLAASPLPVAAGEREVRHPEDLFVVDCLLPAKVRSLGRHTRFAAPRRVVRMSAHECGLRGGEHAADPSDLAWALQAWTAQAEAGDAEAMNNVGEIWEQGVRGQADAALAAQWYRRAAEAGSRRAQTNLGALYEQGLGVERDEHAALAWYRRAAGLTGEADLDAQREIEALQTELAASRAEAEAARAGLLFSGGQFEAGAVEVAGRELEARQVRVAELEAAQDRYRRMLAELEAATGSGEMLAALGPSDLAGRPAPKIQFVRPDVLVTRGPSIVTLPAGGAVTEVVGRVESSLGLASLLVDGRPLEADAHGYFRVRVEATPGSAMRFVAVDRARRQATAELQFVGAAAAPATAVAAASASVATRTGERRRAHALIVANGNYRSLPALATARADGEAMARVLAERFGYRTTLLLDATFLDTVKALDALGRELGPDGDLLVYYAGHGRMEASGDRGYWLPVDAREEDPSTWIPNEAIARILATFAAGRILVVSDSCYAGAFAASGFEVAGGSGGAKSRLVLTSGGLQPVLDAGGDGSHSIFARALLSVLQLAPQPLSASDVFSAVAARVAWKSSQLGLAQAPQLAPIRYAGHEAGELVLTPGRG
ncbi:MAG: caspase family protein [Thermoanaerobaculia bacterium]|nr:caspase family protein [Thermoanaerobaculia bacterium]